ncbi:MAG: AAA family ATPase [Lentisphaerae bacterium]|jgi:BioD-like phosphotransacetylase family protein|nr:AAA family ATPase [Lentisphaerota bacterium]MBT4820306.1 AAA family ATPase [Lentisphaerota bacterium]MBT5604767.1 AAA family ATPase [Lentisphaerota bacterium]MBT7053899.1 AAA family ATPase [Lentisphaerota bacterium]MBT7842821.1 AAA family ATPase [Lentisphaerota bacterium]
MRPVYVSATVQDSGKTSVSLGLMQVLQEQGLNPGYIKPVGQHYVRYHDTNVDEDAVLIHQVFNLLERPYCLSPIAIERGFTTKFIFNPDVAPLEKAILDCVDELGETHSMLIVEGTGHAGVGSCFSLSNARVAELVGGRVVIVTGGGVGRPIDEIAVSLALFEKHDVEVVGVVLNKVLPAKYEKIQKTVSRGLENLDTTLLGAIPYEPSLTHFTVGQLAEEFRYRVLWGEDNLSNRIEKTVVAAMEPEHVVEYIEGNTLLIVPGDRLDNILVAVIVMAQEFASDGGIILTGGIEPHPTIARLMEETGIPVLISDDDTFKVSSRMSDLGFKIRTFDTDKISTLHSLVRDYVDTDRILAALQDDA